MDLARSTIARSSVALRSTALGVGLFILVSIQRYRSLPKKVKWIPESLPIVGCILPILDGLRNYTLLDLVAEWHAKLGKTCAFTILTQTFVGTIDPKNIEHVLKTNFKNYEKGDFFRDPFTDLLGDGIFNIDGDKWLHQRKTASHMFNQKKFEGHIWLAIQKNIAKVYGILEKATDTFDMFNLLNRFTLDTIGEIGFSKSIGSLEDPTSPFLKSFDRAQQIMLLRVFTRPVWKIMKLFQIGWEKEATEHLDRLDKYARGIVRELKEKTETGEDNSFVGLFIKQEWKKDSNPAEREKFMRDMVLNFLIAGRDTTAQCLSWTLFELVQHPEVVKKIQEEVSSVCGGESLKFEHIKKLRYTQAVLDEGLRLHPSVPLDAKIALRNDILPDGTEIMANNIVMYDPYGQGRDKDLWGDDALVFRPERWLEFQNKPSTFVFTAFNAGPRECLGRRLAEVEMCAFLVGILQTFEFTLQCDPKDIHYDAQLTIGMRGLPMTVSRIAQK